MNIQLRICNYINRYAPSEKKLKEYLSRKNHTHDFQALLEEVGYKESLMCELWIKSYLACSKWEREIREKLLKKWFSKDRIHTTLEAIHEELYDWEIHHRNIELIIEGMLKKWKSKKIIFIKLREKYPYFIEHITHLLEAKVDDFWLKKEVEKYLIKYDISDYKERVKFFSALERKGFNFRMVNQYLKEMWESPDLNNY